MIVSLKLCGEHIEIMATSIDIDIALSFLYPPFFRILFAKKCGEMLIEALKSTF